MRAAVPRLLGPPLSLRCKQLALCSSAVSPEGEGWKIAVDTPLYQARERGETTLYFCKTFSRTFKSARQFVQHVRHLDGGKRRKMREDIVFEEAVGQLAVAEPSQSLRSVTAGEFRLEMRDSELVLKGGDGVQMKGLPAIREFLSVSDNLRSPEERRLANLVKTYIPLQPRPDYSVAAGMALVQRKMQETAPITIKLRTKARVVPSVPSPLAYITGSVKERLTLPPVTKDPTCTRFPCLSHYSCGPGELGFDVSACSFAGTPCSPLVATPSGEMTLLEFVYKTNARSYNKDPFVVKARKLLSFNWA